MDKKLFSYSLFEPKSLPQHRYWDKWKQQSDRYWYNIPSLMLTNTILFPNYEIVFYVSENVWDNPLSSILNILEDSFEHFTVQTVRMDYQLTEPAIWRMMPLWYWDVSILHARDIDSLPSREELLYIKGFEESSCCVGTIRSHENHHGVACRMLAGLSSFKPNQIPLSIRGPDFNYYYSQKHQRYGSDQDLMVHFFTQDSSFTEEYFLDYKISNQHHKQVFPCKELDDSRVELTLTSDQNEVLSTIESLHPVEWLGEPCDARGEYMNFIFSKFSAVKELIDNNKILKSFYTRKEVFNG